MRFAKFSTWLFLGGALLLLRARRRHSAARRAADAMPVLDDDEPVPVIEGIDEAGELYVDEVSVDAQSRADAEAADDLAQLVGEDEDEVVINEASLGLDRPWSPEPYHNPRAARGSGELYDVHVVEAEDKALPDEDTAYGEGENWFEHLEASAGEYGPKPEQVLDVVDDSDEHGGTPATDTRDIPVADRGSAGPRGL